MALLQIFEYLDCNAFGDILFLFLEGVIIPWLQNLNCGGIAPALLVIGLISYTSPNLS